MFEHDSDEQDGEEDPFFNADEIAFKIRLQCHKDRKHIVKKLVRSGQIDTSVPAEEAKSLLQT